MTQYVSAIDEEAQRNGVSPDPIIVYHGISPIASTSPPPLFKLAYHILSICPNSASCERLFSIFGNTLTKLRNRLGNQTLTSLAELKMHIRDEHLRNSKTKNRMKRFFGAKTSTSSVPPVSTVPQVPQQPSTSASTSPPTSKTETDCTTQMEVDPISQSPDDVINKFNHITGSFTRQAGGDDDDGDGQMPSVISIEIANLFDFTKTSWIPSHERSASRSLEEELELYELLDLDAPGEEDINLEIDHALDSVLHHV
jgi:hAT family C-terminal dimerisation region